MNPTTSAVRTTTDASFAADTANGVTIVDLWAPWCGPCKAFEPIFEAVADRYDGLANFMKLDLDENPASASSLGVMSVPTLVAFGADGAEICRQSGAMSEKAFIDFVEAALRT